MNNMVDKLKLIFAFHYDFILAPDGSKEEQDALYHANSIRDSLAKDIGWKKALIYTEHMEYLARCKQWEHCREKYDMYLTMRSKSAFETSL